MTTARATDHGIVVCSEGKTLFIPRDDVPDLLLVGASLLQQTIHRDKVAQSIGVQKNG